MMNVSLILSIMFLLFIHESWCMDSNLPSPSSRSFIDSFKVMDVMAKATDLESLGRKICHMEVCKV